MYGMVTPQDVENAVKEVQNARGGKNTLGTRLDGMESDTHNSISKSLSDAKSYADSQMNRALSDSKSYTDNKTGSILSESKKYSDNASNAALSNAKKYADDDMNKALNNAKSYADSQMNKALSDAKSYSDKVLNESKNYTNVQIGNLKVPDLKKAVDDIQTNKWFDDKFIKQFDGVFPTKLQQQFPGQLNKVLSPNPVAWFESQFKNNFGKSFPGGTTPDIWFKNQFGNKTPDDWFKSLFGANFLPSFNGLSFSKNNIPDIMNFQKGFNQLAKPLGDIKSRLDAMGKPLQDIVNNMNGLMTKQYKYPGYDVNIFGVSAYDRSPITGTGIVDYLTKTGDRLNARVTEFAGGRKQSLVDIVFMSGLMTGPVMRDMGTAINQIKQASENLLKITNELKSAVDNITKSLPKPPKEVPGIWKP